MAPCTTNQGTPMPETVADAAVDYLIRSIDGLIAVVNEYKQPE